MTVKQELYNKCIQFVEARLKTVQNVINEIHESLLSETKSSAGDKHETGRAMLQLEREKAGNQLAETEKLKQILYKIDVSKSHKIIGLGSIIYTPKHHYFISISIGKLQVGDELFYAISPNTPIGQLLLGKTKGDSFVFQNEAILIENVL